MTDDIEDKLDQLTNDVKADVAAEKKGRKAKAAKDVGEDDSDEGINLSAAEKAAITAEVEAEVAKELKATKRKEFKAAEKARLKKQVLFRHGQDEKGEDTELVLITLASHTPHLRLDNDLYYPGRAYRLSRGKAAVVKEQMYRGDLHDAEIHGKKMSEFYGQRPRALVIGPNNPAPADLFH